MKSPAGFARFNSSAIDAEGGGNGTAFPSVSDRSRGDGAARAGVGRRLSWAHHQAAVESELKHGEVAVVLFWNPRGADDDAVHTELEVLLAAHHEIRSVGHVKLVQKLLKIVGLELDRKIAVHYASAAQVSSFGSFTKTVQVYGTPTMLIINRHGAISTLTGLTDAFSIEQTIDEARQSP